MIAAEFGIIDDFDKTKDYSVYEPERYHRVYIDDDLYIGGWWARLVLIAQLIQKAVSEGKYMIHFGV